MARETQEMGANYDKFGVYAARCRSCAQKISETLARIDALRQKAVEVEAEVNRLEREAIALGHAHAAALRELERLAEVERRAAVGADLREHWFGPGGGQRGGTHGGGKFV